MRKLFIILAALALLSGSAAAFRSFKEAQHRKAVAASLANLEVAAMEASRLKEEVNQGRHESAPVEFASAMREFERASAEARSLGITSEEIQERARHATTRAFETWSAAQAAK